MTFYPLQGSRTLSFLSQNSDEFCDRIKLSILHKQGDEDTIRFDDDNSAVSDKTLENKCFTKTQ